MKMFRWKQRKDEDLDAEIRNHLDEAIRDRIARGESPEEARVNALREFGNVGLVKEVTREAWGWGAMERVMQDFRFGTRILFKQPGFTLVVVVTLAAGIGLNSAIFSVLNSILLRPLPYRESERLVQIWTHDQNDSDNIATVSPSDFLDWREQAQSFESLSAYNVTFASMTTAEGTVQIYGAAVTKEFFKTLGVAPLRGRTFEAREEQAGGDQVVIVSYDFWQQRLSGSPDVIGQTLILSDVPCRIIGVMRPEFRHPEPIGDQPTRYWRPLRLQEGASRKARYLRAVGRLRQGVGMEQARAEMNAITGRLGQAYPESNAHRRFSMTSLHRQFTGEVRLLLLLLQGAVGVVLLIACVNVANLLLTQMAAREREIAIRSALGAGRWRIVRLLLTECFLLTVLGCGVGLLLARWAVDVLAAMAPREYFRVAEIRLDGRALAFTAALSLATVLLCGLAPAWQAARTNLNVVLSGNRQAVRGRRLRDYLIITEVAAAMVLLLFAGLMLRSLAHLQNTPLGFNADNLLTMELIARSVESDQRADFYDRLLKRVESLPGVRGAAITYSLPLDKMNNMSAEVEIDSRSAFGNGSQPAAYYRSISPGYLQLMGIPLRSGRSLNERDRNGARPVILVNEVFAQRYFPDGRVIGQRIASGISANGERLQREIVGVVASNRHAGLLEEPEPEIFVPLGQDAWNIVTLAVRTHGKPEGMAVAVQSAIWQLDRSVSITRVRSMDQILRELMARPRFNLLLFGIFGMVALVLATVGVYSVMSFTVAQMAREIGIRVALGAQGGHVLRLVLRRGMKMALFGLSLGLVASFALARLVQSFLFGVSATDPGTITVTSILLALAVGAACWIPARRATKVDPLVTLRSE
jgi:putative ABC transport system permease protein